VGSEGDPPSHGKDEILNGMVHNTIVQVENLTNESKTRKQNVHRRETKPWRKGCYKYLLRTEGCKISHTKKGNTDINKTCKPKCYMSLGKV